MAIQKLRKMTSPYLFINKLMPKQWLGIIVSFLLITSTLNAQVEDIVLQDPVIGTVTVSAPGSVTMKPGFHAISGCNFHAYIGPLQEQEDTITIPSYGGNGIPATGSTEMNYISSITVKEPLTELPQSGAFKHIQEIKYFDGLGRPSQIVQVGASPSVNDIIQPILYDAFGREVIKTLPYTDVKSGAFRTNVTETTINDFYNSSGTSPEGIEENNRAFTSIGFDNSPLNRMVSKTGPGTAWEDKPVTINYLSNTETKNGWRVSGNYTYTSLTYELNTLFVIETIDEDGNYTREYKDNLGQVVLKEAKLGNEWLQTVYIYDDLGLLRCVVPPKGSNPNTDLDLCFYYLYDNKSRLIEKKIPGGGVIKMVYDKRDRLRATQNSLQTSRREWTFTKYDELNRPIITGIIKNFTTDTSVVRISINGTSINETRENSATYYGYNNGSFPSGTIPVTEVQTVIYYDDYSFLDISNIDIPDSLRSTKYDIDLYNFASKIDITPKGLVTGTMTKVLSDSADNSSIVPLKTLYSATYYDKFGHVLRSISENHLKGKDIISNLYEDITFQLVQSKQEHYKGQESIVIEKVFEYDHSGRLLATQLKVNDQQPITLNAMIYNEVGEMITKFLHSNQITGNRSFIQKTDYQYNIRGWLTKINDPDLGSDNDVFGMELFYNDITGLGNTIAPEAGLFNGNIAGMKWGINKEGEPQRGYQFSYDNLNRLLQANYAEGSSLDSNVGYNSEIISGYDKNGNILGLQRKFEGATVDNLNISYITNTNKISSILDSGSSTDAIDDYPGNSQTYNYDLIGNLVFDGAKNTNTSYFRTLNLPQKIIFNSTNRIYYHYSAGGVKLLKHTIPSPDPDILTHYLGNIVYQGGAIIYILTEEGRLLPFGTGDDRVFKPEYSLKDHLGNSRVTFMGTDLGGSLDIVQTTSYYPFGLVMVQSDNLSVGDPLKNKYLYNGKEMQSEILGGSSLNWFDYGARFYDPQIGRFTTVDPLTEKFYFLTPYQYGSNNPITNIDIDGLEGVPFNASWLIAKWAEFKARTQEVTGAVSRLLTGTSGSNVPTNIIFGTNISNKTLATWKDVGIVADGVNDLANGAATVLGNVPGAETLVDAGGALINLAEGDLEGAAPYALGLLLPISGKQLKTGEKGLEEIVDAAGSGTPRIKSTKQLRSEWETLNGEAWPKDPETGRNMVAHHKKALADGGSDAGSNIAPKTNKEHVQGHVENGDFKRWGKRRKEEN
jgi:RHS repeat-associated protein